MEFQKQLHERRSPHASFIHKVKETTRYLRSEELGPNNQLVTKQMEVTTHPSEELNKYCVSDFCMANQKSIGAELSPCKASSDNRFSVMDKANEMLDSLDEINLDKPKPNK